MDKKVQCCARIEKRRVAEESESKRHQNVNPQMPVNYCSLASHVSQPRLSIPERGSHKLSMSDAFLL